MSQARTIVADDGEPKYPPNPLVCTISPHGTLTNCSVLAEFLGMRMSCWEAAAMEFSDRDGQAVWLILNSISEALEWEAERVQYKRKTESEVAMAAAELRVRREAANG